MDSFELNKIAGAVLGAALLIFGGKTFAEIAWHEPKMAKPGYQLAVTTTSAGGAAAAAFDPSKVIAAIGKANADAGQDLFKQCTACHTPNKGGENKVGPNLWGVINRKVAEVAGFNYSDALKAKGGTWTWETLAAYLHNPRVAVPGNKMAYAGLRDDNDLADMLAYLRKQADAPAALPQ